MFIVNLIFMCNFKQIKNKIIIKKKIPKYQNYNKIKNKKKIKKF